MKNLIIIILALLTTTPSFGIGICWPSCQSKLRLDDRHWQIVEQGVGFFAIGLNQDLMEDAARTALAAGYSSFKLSQANQYEQYSAGSFNAYRSGGWTNGNINSTRHGTASAVVFVCNAGEPDCAGALDARAILNREGE
jgi:hypothetical protein